MGFLGSMSATRKWRQQKLEDPLLNIEEKLIALWGGVEKTRSVVFPLVMKMGVLT